MRIYGVTNLIKDGYYNSIQQISTDPYKLDCCAQEYIIWYKDWNTDKPLDMAYMKNIVPIQDDWKIWECSSRIFDCSYYNGIIYQEGDGVLEIEYKEGKLEYLKYWINKEDYLKNNNPNICLNND